MKNEHGFRAKMRTKIEEGWDPVDAAWYWHSHPDFRPQGEGHEAGIEAAAEAIRVDLATDEPTPDDLAEVGIAAYLARVSPSRDGTVAVEDVAEWLRKDANGYDGVQARAALLDAADAFLAEFSPASTGDHEHEWVDARNSSVESGEVCLGCGAIRASTGDRKEKR